MYQYIPPKTEAASSHGQRLQLGLSGPQAAAPPLQSQSQQQQLFCGGHGGQNPPGQPPPGHPPPGQPPPGQPPPGQPPPGQPPPGQPPPGQPPPGQGQGGQKKPPPLLFWHCCLKMPVPPGQKQLPKPPLPPPKPQEGNPVELHAIYHLPFLA
jgi:hypothetical protein